MGNICSDAWNYDQAFAYGNQRAKITLLSGNKPCFITCQTQIARTGTNVIKYCQQTMWMNDQTLFYFDYSAWSYSFWESFSSL